MSVGAEQSAALRDLPAYQAISVHALRNANVEHEVPSVQKVSPCENWPKRRSRTGGQFHVLS